MTEIVIGTFKDLHPEADADRDMIEDVLYKAAVILMNRKSGLFRKKIRIGLDDISYVMNNWDTEDL